MNKKRRELLIEMCVSFIINNKVYESVYINKLRLNEGITLDDFLFKFNKDKHILIIEIIEKGKPPFFEDLKIRMNNGYKCTICNKKIIHINDKYSCDFCNFSLFCSKICVDKSLTHINLDKKLILIKTTNFTIQIKFIRKMEELLKKEGIIINKFYNFKYFDI